jgi:hypothetical protein
MYSGRKRKHTASIFRAKYRTEILVRKKFSFEIQNKISAIKHYEGKM